MFVFWHFSLFGSQLRVFKVASQPSYLIHVREDLIRFDCQIVHSARLTASATDCHKALPPQRINNKINNTAGTYPLPYPQLNTVLCTTACFPPCDCCIFLFQCKCQTVRGGSVVFPRVTVNPVSQPVCLKIPTTLLTSHRTLPEALQKKALVREGQGQQSPRCSRSTPWSCSRSRSSNSAGMAWNIFLVCMLS